MSFDKEELYVKIATERVEKISPISAELLEYKIERKKPKVPFGNLIEKGYIKIGENLYSKDGSVKAKVLADATLECDEIVGSIHKVSAHFMKRDNYNGWSYWFVLRDGKFISIDNFRYDYEKKYLKTAKNKEYIELEFEEINTVNESNEDFLNYGNNEI